MKVEIIVLWLINNQDYNIQPIYKVDNSDSDNNFTQNLYGSYL